MIEFIDNFVKPFICFFFHRRFWIKDYEIVKNERLTKIYFNCSKCKQRQFTYNTKRI